MEQSNVLAQKNEDKLKTETERLQERNSSPCRCWIWMLLSIVCFTFIGKSSQKVVVVRLEILFVREIAYRENRNLIFQPWSGSWSFLGNESGMTSYDNGWFNLNLTSNRKLLQNISNFWIYHRQTSASLSNVSQMNGNVACQRFRLITHWSLFQLEVAGMMTASSFGMLQQRMSRESCVWMRNIQCSVCNHRAKVLLQYVIFNQMLKLHGNQKIKN